MIWALAVALSVLTTAKADERHNNGRAGCLLLNGSVVRNSGGRVLCLLLLGY